MTQAEIKADVILSRVNEVYDILQDLHLHPAQTTNTGPKQKMMNFQDFSAAYGIPVATLRDWKDKERGFAGTVAFRLGPRWYISIPHFEKWMRRKHTESYAYV